MLSYHGVPVSLYRQRGIGVVVAAVYEVPQSMGKISSRIVKI